MDLPNFRILTERSILDINYESEDVCCKSIDELIKEQKLILKVLGVSLNATYAVHFFDSIFFDDTLRFDTVSDAIQYLAIKDGYDLVQYDNGHYGYVAYYNGNCNGFEILQGKKVTI